MTNDLQLENPLVSIVVPSYNQGQFIDATLQSIFVQDYAPLEILVLDGGSTDQTVSILKQYENRNGFHWKSERDKGVVDAVNQGLAKASGQFCGILSSDDCYSPGTIRAAVAALRSRPELILVYADAEYINEQGQVTGRTNVEDYSLSGLLSRRTFIVQSSAFFRTDTARSVGAWRREVSYVADNDLWLRMALHGPFARVRGIWSQYRFHSNQRENQSQRIVRDWQKAIEDLRPQLGASKQRAASLGCHLTAYRYAGANNWWPRTKSLYAAVATDPSCLFWKEFPRIELLQPIRQFGSRCKRFVRTALTMNARQPGG